MSYSVFFVPHYCCYTLQNRETPVQCLLEARSSDSLYRLDIGAKNGIPWTRAAQHF